MNDFLIKKLSGEAFPELKLKWDCIGAIFGLCLDCSESLSRLCIVLGLRLDCIELGLHWDCTGRGIPGAAPKLNGFLIKKLIWEAFPEPEPKIINSLIQKLIWS